MFIIRRIEDYLNQEALLPYLARHLLQGVLLGVFMSLALLYVDFAGLNTLIQGSSEPVVPLFMLFFGLCITFGSVSMGIAVMGIPKREGEIDREPKDPELHPEGQPGEQDKGGTSPMAFHNHR